MFICSECGKKYEIMPEFCDCGNDIFLQEETFENNILEPKEPTASKRNRKIEKISPLSIGVFAICIILSLATLLFIGNPSNDKESIADNESVANTKKEIIAPDIPSIDTFWDDTAIKKTPKQEQKEELKELSISENISEIAKNIIPQNNNPTTSKPNAKPQVKSVKAPQKTVKPQTTSKPQTKTVNNPQNSGQKTTQTVDNSAKNITNRVKNKIKYNTNTNQTPSQQSSISASNQQQTVKVQQSSVPASNPASSKNNQITQSQKTATSASQQQSQTQSKSKTQTQTQTSVHVKSQAELNKELSAYKVSLQNTIGRKIDFTRVIGDGECSLSFKISSNGKIISRAFTKQSSNITLNDVVYNAMMSTNSFNPPPEGYNGETLYLKIKFYNGNFVISLN